MEFTTLKNGNKMPMEGFGVFQIRDAEICKQSVLSAIRAGYRLIILQPFICIRLRLSLRTDSIFCLL